MAGFNLTAQLNLVGPTNVRKIASDIRRELSSVDVNVNVRIDPKSVALVRQLTGNINQLSAGLNQISGTTRQVSTDINQLGQSLNSIKTDRVAKDTQQAAKATQQLGDESRTAARDVKVMGSELAEFGRQSGLAIRRFAAFSLVSGVMYKLNSAVNSSIDSFIAFDKEVVRLSQVTGKGVDELQGLVKTLRGLSTNLGVSSDELIKVTSTLAQAGLTARQTEEALKALALSVNAPSFDNLTDTTEGVIAAMRQFNIDASDLTAVLGSINAVSAQFAVEAGDIIKAIQRTGGVFASASRGVAEGTEALNQFIAVFTQVRATTRESAETIATGLRTIFARIQRADTIEALRAFGVELTDLEGKFVGPYEAIARLSAVLNQLDPRSLEVAKITEELGGFRQIGKVIPLIQQFSTAQAALNAAQAGSGSLLSDNAKAQQALAVQLIKVREEFKTLISDIGNNAALQSFLKITLGITTAVLKLAQAGKSLFPLLTIFAGMKAVSALTEFTGGFLQGIDKVPNGPGGKKQSVSRTVGSGISGILTGSGSGGDEREFAALTAQINTLIPIIGNMTAIINQQIAETNANTAALTLNTASIDALASAVQASGGAGLYRGGKVMGFKTGGLVPGNGGGDRVPALLEGGEVVMSRDAVKRYGAGNLVRMNNYAGGGMLVSDLNSSGLASEQLKNATVTTPEEPFLTGRAINSNDMLEYSLKRQPFTARMIGNRLKKIEKEESDIIRANLKNSDNKTRGNAFERLLVASGSATGKSTFEKSQTYPVDFDGSAYGEAKTELGIKDAEFVDKLFRARVQDKSYSGLQQTPTSEGNQKINLGHITAYETSKAELDKLAAGGFVQRFMAGGVTDTNSPEYLASLIQRIKDVGGAAFVARQSGITDVVQRNDLQKKTLNGVNIKMGRDIDVVLKYLQKAESAAGVQAVEAKKEFEEARKGAFQVQIAGMLPIAHKFDQVYDIEGRRVNLIARGLDEKYRPAVEKMQGAARDLATNFGSEIQNLYGEPAQLKTTTAREDEIFGQGNIEGAVIEKALYQLGAPLVPGSKQNRRIDYMGGLGSAAKYFTGLSPNIPTEVKRIINGDSLEDTRGKIANGFAEQLFASGGLVQKFMAGGFSKPVSSKQLAFLESLVAKNGVPEGFEYPPKTSAQASALIDRIKNPPKQGLDLNSLFKEYNEIFGMAHPQANEEFDEQEIKDWTQNIDRTIDKYNKFANVIKEYYEKIIFQDSYSGGFYALGGPNPRMPKRAELDQFVNGGFDRKLLEEFGKRGDLAFGSSVNAPRGPGANSSALRTRKTYMRGYADGGTVSAMVSNGEAFVPPETAKKIGYANLERMNQADRNGMTGFAAGGISVFKGPGSGTSDSIGPIGLPNGGFVIREKATKALGLNRGGAVGVRNFKVGGQAEVEVIFQSLADQFGTTIQNVAGEFGNALNTYVKESLKMGAAYGDINRGAIETVVNTLRKNVGGKESEKLIKNLTGSRLGVGAFGTRGSNVGDEDASLIFKAISDAIVTNAVKVKPAPATSTISQEEIAKGSAGVDVAMFDTIKRQAQEAGMSLGEFVDSIKDFTKTIVQQEVATGSTRAEARVTATRKVSEKIAPLSGGSATVGKEFLDAVNKVSNNLSKTPPVGVQIDEGAAKAVNDIINQYREKLSSSLGKAAVSIDLYEAKMAEFESGISSYSASALSATGGNVGADASAAIAGIEASISKIGGTSNATSSGDVASLRALEQIKDVLGTYVKIAASRPEEKTSVENVSFDSIGSVVDHLNQLSDFDPVAFMQFPGTLVRLDKEISAAEKELEDTLKTAFSEARPVSTLQRKEIANSTEEVKGARTRLEQAQLDRTFTQGEEDAKVGAAEEYLANRLKAVFSRSTGTATERKAKADSTLEIQVARERVERAKKRRESALAPKDAQVLAAQADLSDKFKTAFSEAPVTAVEQSTEVQTARAKVEELKSSRTSKAVSAGMGVGLEGDAALALTEYYDKINQADKEVASAADKAKQAADAEAKAVAQQKRVRAEELKNTSAWQKAMADRMSGAKVDLSEAKASAGKELDLNPTTDAQIKMEAAANATARAMEASVIAAEQLRQKEEERRKLGIGADGGGALAEAAMSTDAGIAAAEQAQKAREAADALATLKQQAIQAGVARAKIATGSRRQGESPGDYKARLQGNIMDQTRRSAREMGLVKTRVMSPREAAAEQEKAQKAEKEQKQQTETKKEDLSYRAQDLLIKAINENTKAVSGNADSTAELESEMEQLKGARAEAPTPQVSAGTGQKSFDINKAFEDETYTIKALDVIDDFGAKMRSSGDALAASFTDLEGNTSRFGKFMQGLGGKLDGASKTARNALASVNESFVNTKVGSVFKSLSSVGGLLTAFAATSTLSMASEGMGGYKTATGGSLAVAGDVLSTATNFAALGAMFGPFGTAVGAATGTVKGLVDGLMKWRDALEQAEYAAQEVVATQAAAAASQDFAVFFDSVEPDFEDFASGIQNLNKTIAAEEEMMRSRQGPRDATKTTFFGKRDLEGKELADWSREVAQINAGAGAASRDVIRRFVAAGNSIEEVQNELGPQTFRAFANQIAEADAVYQQQVREARKTSKTDAEFRSAVAEARDAAVKRAISDLEVQQANEEYRKNVTEARQRLESVGTGVLEKIIGNTPEENQKYAKSLRMARGLMEGDVNATKAEEEKAFNKAYNEAGGGIEGERAGEAAAAQIRKEATAAGNELLSFGDPQNQGVRDARAMMLETQLKGQGVDTNTGIAKQVLDSLRAPDPALDLQGKIAENTAAANKHLAEIAQKELGITDNAVDAGDGSAQDNYDKQFKANSNYGYVGENQGTVLGGLVAGTVGLGGLVLGRNGIRRNVRDRVDRTRNWFGDVMSDDETLDARRRARAETPDDDMARVRAEMDTDDPATGRNKPPQAPDAPGRSRWNPLNWFGGGGDGGGDNPKPRSRTPAPSAPDVPKRPRRARGLAGVLGWGAGLVGTAGAFTMGASNATAEDTGGTVNINGDTSDTGEEFGAANPEIIALLAAIEQNTRECCMGGGGGGTPGAMMAQAMGMGGGAFSIPPELIKQQTSDQPTPTETEQALPPKTLKEAVANELGTANGLLTAVPSVVADVVGVRATLDDARSRKTGVSDADGSEGATRTRKTSADVEAEAPSRGQKFRAVAAEGANIAMQAYGTLESARFAGEEFARGNYGYAASESAGVLAGGLNVAGSIQNIRNPGGGPNKLGAAGDAFSFIRNISRFVTGQAMEEDTVVQDSVSAFADALQVSQQLPPNTLQNVKGLMPGGGTGGGGGIFQNLKDLGPKLKDFGKNLPKTLTSLPQTVSGMLGTAKNSMSFSGAAQGTGNFLKGMASPQFLGNAGLFNSLITGGFELNDAMKRTDPREIQDRNTLGMVNTVNALDPFSAVGGMVDAVGGLAGVDVGAEKTLSLSRNIDRGLGMLGITEGKGETIGEVANETLSIRENLQRDRGGINRKVDEATGEFVARTAEDSITTRDLKTIGKGPDSRRLILEGLRAQAAATGQEFTGKIGGIDIMEGDLSKIDFSASDEGKKNVNQLSSALNFAKQKKQERIDNRLPGLSWITGDTSAEEDLGFLNSMETEARLLRTQTLGGTGADVEAVSRGAQGSFAVAPQPKPVVQASGTIDDDAAKVAAIYKDAPKIDNPSINATAAMMGQAFASPKSAVGDVRAQTMFGTDPTAVAQMMSGDPAAQIAAAASQVSGGAMQTPVSNMALQEAQGIVANEKNIDTSNLYGGGALTTGGIDAALNQYDEIQALEEAKKVVAANEAANVVTGMTPAGPGQPTGGENLIPVSQQTAGGGVSTGVGGDMEAVASQIGMTIANGFGAGATQMLQATFGGFIEQLGAIQFPKVPDVINMQGTHTVEVIINGADVLKGMQESIQTMISEKINEKVKWINNQTEGGLGP